VTVGTKTPDPIYPQFMTAWHGSPHDHKGFSVDYIDSSKGAQNCGWGMYFADTKDIAEFYREQLSRSNALSDEQLAKYFQPGKIVASYGGQDRVVFFRGRAKQVIDKYGGMPAGCAPEEGSRLLSLRKAFEQQRRDAAPGFIY